MRYSEIVALPMTSPTQVSDEGLSLSVPPLWSVDLPGLDRESMGDRAFEVKLRAVIAWCRQNCPNFQDAYGLRDKGRLVGRTFVFGSQDEAALFKLWWG